LARTYEYSVPPRIRWPEHARFRRVQIGRDRHRAFLVGGVHQAVEALGGIGGHRQQSNVIDHDQLGAQDAPDRLDQTVVGPVTADEDAQVLEGEPVNFPPLTGHLSSHS
jgi:hypothetical protein